MIAKPKQRPETLAHFAETARTEKRRDESEERELRHLHDLQLSEGEDEIVLDETDIDVTLEEDDELADSGVTDGQKPVNMNSYDDDYADEDDPPR